jgi:hypothetical protein
MYVTGTEGFVFKLTFNPQLNLNLLLSDTSNPEPVSIPKSFVKELET